MDAKGGVLLDERGERVRGGPQVLEQQKRRDRYAELAPFEERVGVRGSDAPEEEPVAGDPAPTGCRAPPEVGESASPPPGRELLHHQPPLRDLDGGHSGPGVVLQDPPIPRFERGPMSIERRLELVGGESTYP